MKIHELFLINLKYSLSIHLIPYASIENNTDQTTTPTVSNKKMTTTLKPIKQTLINNTISKQKKHIVYISFNEYPVHWSTLNNSQFLIDNTHFLQVFPTCTPAPTWAYLNPRQRHKNAGILTHGLVQESYVFLVRHPVNLYFPVIILEAASPGILFSPLASCVPSPTISLSLFSLCLSGARRRYSGTARRRRRRRRRTAAAAASARHFFLSPAPLPPSLFLSLSTGSFSTPRGPEIGSRSRGEREKTSGT